MRFRKPESPSANPEWRQVLREGTFFKDSNSRGEQTWQYHNYQERPRSQGTCQKR